MSNSGEVVRYFVMSVILIRNSDGKSLEYDETFSHFYIPPSSLLYIWKYKNVDVENAGDLPSCQKYHHFIPGMWVPSFQQDPVSTYLDT